MSFKLTDDEYAECERLHIEAKRIGEEYFACPWWRPLKKERLKKAVYRTQGAVQGHYMLMEFMHGG